MSANVIEKRKHKRYDIRDLAFVGAAIAGRDMEHFAGIVVDISAEGIGLHFPVTGFDSLEDFHKLFKKHDPIQLRLQLMNGNERFEIKADIVWTGITDHIKTHPYSIGCHFVDRYQLPQSVKDRFD